MAEEDVVLRVQAVDQASPALRKIAQGFGMTDEAFRKWISGMKPEKLKELAKTIGVTEESLRKMTAAERQAAQGMDQLGKSCSGAKSALGVLVGVMGTLGFAKLGADLGRLRAGIVGTGVQFGLWEARLRAVYRSSGEAATAMRELWQIAEEATTVDMPELVEARIRLEQLGLATDNPIKMLRLLANTAEVTGDSVESISQRLSLMNAMFEQGKQPRATMFTQLRITQQEVEKFGGGLAGVLVALEKNNRGMEEARATTAGAIDEMSDAWTKFRLDLFRELEPSIDGIYRLGSSVVRHLGASSPATKTLLAFGVVGGEAFAKVATGVTALGTTLLALKMTGALDYLKKMGIALKVLKGMGAIAIGISLYLIIEPEVRKALDALDRAGLLPSGLSLLGTGREKGFGPRKPPFEVGPYGQLQLPRRPGAWHPPLVLPPTETKPGRIGFYRTGPATGFGAGGPGGLAPVSPPDVARAAALGPPPMWKGTAAASDKARAEGEKARQDYAAHLERLSQARRDLAKSLMDPMQAAIADLNDWAAEAKKQGIPIAEQRAKYDAEWQRIYDEFVGGIEGSTNLWADLSARVNQGMREAIARGEGKWTEVTGFDPSVFQPGAVAKATGVYEAARQRKAFENSEEQQRKSIEDTTQAMERWRQSFESWQRTLAESLLGGGRGLGDWLETQAKGFMIDLVQDVAKPYTQRLYEAVHPLPRDLDQLPVAMAKATGGTFTGSIGAELARVMSLLPKAGQPSDPKSQAGQTKKGVEAASGGAASGMVAGAGLSKGTKTTFAALGVAAAMTGNPAIEGAISMGMMGFTVAGWPGAIAGLALGAILGSRAKKKAAQQKKAREWLNPPEYFEIQAYLYNLARTGGYARSASIWSGTPGGRARGYGVTIQNLNINGVERAEEIAPRLAGELETQVLLLAGGGGGSEY